MFGLILKIQALLDKLRKNKGLWFSILTAASVLGIIGTLYYLNTMTERVAKNLYESKNAGYFYDLEQTLSNTAQKLQAATALSVANQGYAASFVSANGAETLKAIASAVKGESNVDIVVDFYSKELIGFDNVELDFGNGLTVFTGPSGAGKSVLMDGVLSAFGFREALAQSCELVTEFNLPILDEMGIDNEAENVFRFQKKDKTRYFVNSSQISKKELLGLAKNFAGYLSPKEGDELSGDGLIQFLDSFAPKTHFSNLAKYREHFLSLKELKTEYAELLEKALRASDEKEFLEFEIKKFRLLEQAAISVSDKLKSKNGNICKISLQIKKPEVRNDAKVGVAFERSF